MTFSVLNKHNICNKHTAREGMNINWVNKVVTAGDSSGRSRSRGYRSTGCEWPPPRQSLPESCSFPPLLPRYRLGGITNGLLGVRAIARVVGSRCENSSDQELDFGMTCDIPMATLCLPSVKHWIFPISIWWWGIRKMSTLCCWLSWSEMWLSRQI